MVRCVVLFCKSCDGCLSSSILFKYECRKGHLFVLSCAPGCSGECSFGMKYVERYGVWNCFSVGEICDDYGGVYVCHVYL